MSTIAPPPAKKPPPPPPNSPSSVSSGKAASKTFGVKAGRHADVQKVVIYGPGGVGKSELSYLIGECGVKPLFIDIGDSSRFLDVDRCEPTPQTWEELREALHADWPNHGALIIDDLSKAEEMAVDWTIRNVKHEKNSDKKIQSIEDYGFGKGYVHAYETFLQLLGDLDAQARRGKHIICIAHECTANVPNPNGEDWIRYEPRLQSPASGKSSIRHRVKEWCDHLLFVGFDTAVNKDGKGIGGGTRTIYPTELPSWWAKSRLLSDPIVYERGSAQLWKLLLGKE